jgi:small subunit ribosomal protein S20
MANHPQAAKRARQAEKRRIRNKAVKTGVRSAVKKVLEALEGKDPKVAAEALKVAVSRLDRARSKGVLRRRSVARAVSRLTRKAAQTASKKP